MVEAASAERAEQAADRLCSAVLTALGRPTS